MKYNIYLDFEGTVVENEYPKIGRCNFGCFEIIKKLQDAGHDITLNTARVEEKNDSLQKALDYLNFNPRYEIAPIEKHTQGKWHPDRWDWEIHKARGVIYIDDICYGIPLKKAAMTRGEMVDWAKLDLEFIEHGLYEA